MHRMILLLPVFAFAQDVPNADLTSAGGAIGSLIAIIGLLVKHLTDVKHEKKHVNKTSDIDTKVEKLFQYNDRRNEQIIEINKTLSVIDNHSKDIASLVNDIKEMTKTISQVQQDVTRLVTMQEMLVNRSVKNAGK